MDGLSPSVSATCDQIGLKNLQSDRRTSQNPRHTQWHPARQRQLGLAQTAGQVAQLLHGL